MIKIGLLALRREDPAGQRPLGPLPRPDQADGRQRPLELLGLQPQRAMPFSMARPNTGTDPTTARSRPTGRRRNSRSGRPFTATFPSTGSISATARSTRAPPTATGSRASSSRAWASTGRPAPSSSVESSTYSNLKLSGDIGPAVEYDVFPYSESTKRQLRFLYRVGFTASRYRRGDGLLQNLRDASSRSPSAAPMRSSGPGATPASSSRDPTSSTTSARTGSSSRLSCPSGSGGA